ncbi:MAG: DUF4263 domain-containing protein [Planctomycetes bacterium]|nr:DUF4263 domain-containing protein [Planctomycetota bacterium]
MKLSQTFKQLIDDPSSTERDVHRFLKRYPMLMVRLFNVSWNYYLCIPEFPLGNDYRADFLVLSADSGCWHAVFVELEGPNDVIYLKDGTPSKKLRGAQKQVEDWDKFCSNRAEEVKQQIARVLKPRGRCAQNRLMGCNGLARDEILHPDVFLHRQYKVVIGRRSSFQDEPTHHMPSPGAGYSPRVSTYDRVYDCLHSLESISRYQNLEKYLSCDDRSSVHM